MTTRLICFRRRGEIRTAEDLRWEPDGVALQVRFCEGGGTYHANGIPAATLPLQNSVPRATL